MGFNNLDLKRVIPNGDIDQNCLELLRSSNITNMERCEFYKCFEKRFPCGKEYWIINWGYKYCRRYADENFANNFTTVGQKLLNHVNECLPRYFEKAYKSSRPIQCKKLSNQAFRAQTNCYKDIQKDFCIAFEENKILFVKVMDNSDLMNFESIAMIRKATEKCSTKLNFFSLFSGI
ncbi:stanniocalcin family [Brachionus plicatilis]|uniref:Stanniocalcin family n=1 Tax=Brachionus plicatilis TaxID=10195 RepID=A0A3M7PWF8_BRAPC|nr:stanniocalcin family [Brachionus plicatilis]